LRVIFNSCETMSYRLISRKYNSSTFALAQGVLRKNFKLDLTLESCVKQRMGTASPIASQPMLCESCVTIISKVMPLRGGRFAGLFVVSICSFYRD
jgi:hypothetical protein